MMQKVFGDMPPDYAERAAAASAKANKNLKEKAWFRHNRLDFPSVRRGPLSSAEKNSVSFVNKMKKLEVSWERGWVGMAGADLSRGTTADALSLLVCLVADDHFGSRRPGHGAQVPQTD